VSIIYSAQDNYYSIIPIIYVWLGDATDYSIPSIYVQLGMLIILYDGVMSVRMTWYTDEDSVTTIRDDVESVVYIKCYESISATVAVGSLLLLLLIVIYDGVGMYNETIVMDWYVVCWVSPNLQWIMTTRSFTVEVHLLVVMLIVDC